MNSLREVADPRQQEICGLYGQTALVLGGPGCGKTHVLARRIIKANAEYGVGFDDMLCVTFTNRAAREMEERVRGLAGYVPEGLFTGNLHRFCMRFLLVNGLVESETGIMDDDDLTEYLASTFGITHPADAANFRKAAARVYQNEHDFPERLKQRLRFPLGERESPARSPLPDIWPFALFLYYPWRPPCRPSYKTLLMSAAISITACRDASAKCSGPNFAYFSCL